MLDRLGIGQAEREKGRREIMDELDDAVAAGSVEFVGPFESHDVVLNGRRVPYLTATPLSAGRVCLHLDRRFALELDLQDAEYAVPFMAQCIAIGMGFSGFPDTAGEGPYPAQRIPRVHSLG
jgi:hypothetical protein